MPPTSAVKSMDPSWEQVQHEFEFDGTDFPSGIYFYKLRITNYESEIEYEDTKKMVLIR